MTLKRRVTSKEPGNNFRAGYVHIDEEHLHKTGIRGCKVYLLFFITVALTLIAVANILVTFTILITMRLGYSGVESLEFIPGSNLIRFLTDSHFEDGMLHTPGRILGLPDQEITITGMKNNEVHLTVTDANTTLTLGPYGTQVQADRFDVIDPISGETVFSTDFSQFKFPDQMESIMLENTETSRVVSEVDVDLTLRAGADSDLVVSGMEGVEALSKHVSLRAEQDININCTESILSFDSASGLHLTQVDHIARAYEEGDPLSDEGDPLSEEGENPLSAEEGDPSSGNNTASAAEANIVGFKLCMCMPDALLYAVSAEGRCDEYQSPCVKQAV